MKKFIALLLVLALVLSLAACTRKEEGYLEGDLNNDGQIEMGQDGVEVEVNVSDVHMDAAEAFAAGKWEALFTPIEIEGRGIDLFDLDLYNEIDLTTCVEKRISEGGTSVASVEKQIAFVRTQI